MKKPAPGLDSLGWRQVARAPKAGWDGLVSRKPAAG